MKINNFSFKIKTKDEETHEVFYNTCEDYKENYFKTDNIDYEFFSINGVKLA